MQKEKKKKKASCVPFLEGIREAFIPSREGTQQRTKQAVLIPSQPVALVSLA